MCPSQSVKRVVVAALVAGLLVGGAAPALASQSASPGTHGFVWDVGGGMVDLGTLGGGYSIPVDINANGEIAGDADPSGPTEQPTHGFFWSSGTGFIDLGTLGGDRVGTSAINDAGQVVGTAIDPSGNERAFLWEAGSGMVDLGTLGGSWSIGVDVNASGQVTGIAALAGDAVYHAFIWSAGSGMQDLGNLGFDNSTARDINDAGQVVGTSRVDDEDTHAFLWDGGGPLIDLAPAIALSDATQINEAGQIAGWTGTSGLVRQAAIWQPSAGSFVKTDLGTLGSAQSYPEAMNESGAVIGTSSLNGSNQPLVFYWSSGTGIVSVPTLGGPSARPASLNDDGDVVGFATLPGDLLAHAFLWSVSDGITDLGTLGGELSYATGINDAGQVIGYSTTTTPDSTAPTATSTNDGQDYSLGQSVLADYACQDEAGGSGLASCDGTVSLGAALDTSSAGSHGYDVTAIDIQGNTSITTVTYDVLAGSVSAPAPAGGTVTTDPGGLGASPAVPVQTTITTPVAGTVTVATEPPSVPLPTYNLLGAQISIDAPVATSVTNPLVLSFVIDASLLGLQPDGSTVDASTITVFRDGIAAGECPGATAAPADGTPCVASRSTAPLSGDVTLTLLSLHASDWTLANHRRFAFDGVQKPLVSPPKVNEVKAGSGVAVVFGLGGNQGTAIYASGSPSSTRITCPRGKTTAIKGTVKGTDLTTYDRKTRRYTYAWKTNRSWDGTCRQLTLKLADGTAHTIQFKFD